MHALTPVEREWGRPLSVAVLVDLEWGAVAGGHVKCWERLAEAAGEAGQAISLTVHVQGACDEIVPFGGNVRFWRHRPVLSSSRLAWLRGLADHTDLAPVHPRLLALLRHCDIVHATDAFFAYAGAARWAAALYGVPLVASLHTDVPGYSRVYGERVIRRLAGDGALSSLAIERLHLPERIERYLGRRLRRFLGRCDRLLIPERGADAALQAVLPEAKVSTLRRGVDKQLFHPDKRDRERLSAKWGIPHDCPVLGFAGRLDPSKNVLTLARAARQLVDRGSELRVLLAGTGVDAEAVRALLGERAIFTGVVPQDELAWLYASADMFVFPSLLDVSPNVVLEAKASGLAVLVAPESGSHVRASGIDGLVIPEREPAAWAEAIESLWRDAAKRRALGLAARDEVVRCRPSWRDVLLEDLVPAWRASARRTAGAGAVEARFAPSTVEPIAH